MDYFVSLAAKVGKRKNLNFKLIQEAYIFARDAHKGQKRKSGEDYIMHPAAVAELVCDIGGDEESIIAALLHDVVEDTSITLKIVESKFKSKVVYLVDGLTKLNKISKNQKKNVQYLRKIFFAMSGDLRVVIIKLLDHLHNMKTLGAMPPEKQIKKAKETFEIYVGLAEKLNLWDIKKNLEDLCFKYLWEQSYKDLKKEFHKKQTLFTKDIEKFKKSLAHKLQNEFGETVSVKPDIKSLYEIFQKKGKALKLSDCYFINIILSSSSECYTVLGIIHKHFHPRNHQLQDFLASPKENGYQAIHTTVFSNYGLIDIHIHTKESYKSMLYTNIFSWYQSSNKTEAYKYHWIKRLLQMNKELKNDLDFHSSVTNQVLAKNMTVYSPEGEKNDLPIGSTVLDYLILSSNKPLQYSKIEVNGEEALVLDVLNQNSIIDISPSLQKKQIRYEWLESVKTHHAKTFITQELGGHTKTNHLLKGVKIIEDWIPILSLPPIQELRKVYEKNLLKIKRYSSFEDSAIGIGEGNLSLGNFLDTLIPIHQQAIFRSACSGTYMFNIVVLVSHEEKNLNLGSILNIIFLELNALLPKQLHSKYRFKISNNRLFISYYFTSFSQICAIITKIKEMQGLSSYIVGKY